MRVNISGPYRGPTTYEGAPARQITAYQQLRRSVMACLLWENTFYEAGVEIADRIKDLCSRVEPVDIAALASECRIQYKMRHVSVLLLRELVRHGNGSMVGDTIGEVIRRADELGELLQMYLVDVYGADYHGKKTIPRQLKRGLGIALNRFDAYQLAKYDRSSDAVRLRDVLFLSHAKPRDDQRAAIWKQLVEGTLPSADTWEVGLSTGGDKGEVFTRLLEENKLGYMAVLRNLRNMVEVGVDQDMIRKAILRGDSRSPALPFRFLSAARAAPMFEPELDTAMRAALGQMPKLPGKTNILVDISYSMNASISAKSDRNRAECAAALAALARGVCESCRVFAFNSEVREVPPRQGMALIDTITKVVRGGTDVGRAVKTANDGSRLIVITDEQSRTPVENPKGPGYMVNVGTYQHGIGYGAWTHIDGWSEQVIRYIGETEKDSV